MVAAQALPHINGSTFLHTIPRSYHSRPFFCHRPVLAISMSTNNNHTYWTSLNNEIDAHIKEAMPIRPPLRVFEAMHHLALEAPRTTAPGLCIAACEVVGGQRDQATAAAAALRLMHAASFTHEHLPLVNSAQAQSRAKISHVYEPNMELLIGDGLVPFGFELLAQTDDPVQNKSDRVLRAIIEITRVAGSQGMIEGQFNDLQYGKCNGGEAAQATWLEQACRKKKGELHACAGACGAILGGGKEEEIEKLRRYGLYVGMIQGILKLVESKEKWLVKEVNELRDLALKELKDFNPSKVEAISSLVDIQFCNSHA